MNNLIVKNYFLKASIVSLVGLCSFSAVAAEGDSSENWGSPVATFSNISLGSGSEGIDLSARAGGYLGGVYQHSLEVASKNDLEHYEVNYVLLNTASDSGLTIDSAWSKDVKFKLENDNSHEVSYDDVNNVDVGLYSKLNFTDDRLTAYPKMSVGYMWTEDDIAIQLETTTYVNFEVAFRFNVDDKIWIGATPIYIHGMKGLEIDQLTGTIEAGMQLSDTFGVSAEFNEDDEFLGRVIFAF